MPWKLHYQIASLAYILLLTYVSTEPKDYANAGYHDRWINEKRKTNGQWYTWQTALRLVQGYGRSIRSKEDWAKTYVLDSAFGPFVKKNTNILPNWFTQAIQA
ncbi:MAG: helicase C-terminal domain-containing protein [Candidatus Nitrosopolaris sp.]